jgi:hypothetical protein
MEMLMPQFSDQAQKFHGDLKAISNAGDAEMESLPVGIIGENRNFRWGYTGQTYYVAEIFLESLVT